MKIKRILVSILILVAAYFGSNKVMDVLQDKKNIENYGEAAAASNKGQVVDKELLVLLVGVDKNSDGDDSLTRTDTIMLAKVNVEKGTVDILSIPRDSRVKVRDAFTKVNHAHAYGGIELTLQTLRNFLGIDIDYYVEVDYKAVVNIVDALGGVDYDVPDGIHVQKGSVDINPGLNHMTGTDVLWYLRTRSIYNNGDLGRVDTQQAFVKAMIDEIAKKAKEINLLSLVDTYINYVKTNVPVSMVYDLLKDISALSSKNVKTYTVPGTPAMIDGVSYYLPDFDGTWEIVDKVFSKYKIDGWTKSDSGYDEDNYEEDEGTTTPSVDNQYDDTSTQDDPTQYENNNDGHVDDNSNGSYNNGGSQGDNSSDETNTTPEEEGNSTEINPPNPNEGSGTETNDPAPTEPPTDGEKGTGDDN